MVFQHNYRWDLDKIISPNEGPSAMREYITVSYIQDCKPCTTNKTWRDSAITQTLFRANSMVATGTSRILFRTNSMVAIGEEMK